MTAFIDYDRRAPEAGILPVRVQRKLYRLVKLTSARVAPANEGGRRGRPVAAELGGVSTVFARREVKPGEALRTDALYLDEIVLQSRGGSIHYGLLEAALPPGASVERGTWGVALQRGDAVDAIDKARHETTRTGYTVADGTRRAVSGGAGWLDDGTPIWFGAAGSSRQVLARHANRIAAVLPAADPTRASDAAEDSPCVAVRFFARYPVRSVADENGQPLPQGLGAGKIRITFVNGNVLPVTATSLERVDEPAGTVFRGRFSLDEYIARVIDREGRGEPREATRALAITARSYVVQRGRRNPGCWEIDDASATQRVSPNPPRAGGAGRCALHLGTDGAGARAVSARGRGAGALVVARYRRGCGGGATQNQAQLRVVLGWDDSQAETADHHHPGYRHPVREHPAGNARNLRPAATQDRRSDAGEIFSVLRRCCGAPSLKPIPVRQELRIVCILVFSNPGMSLNGIGQGDAEVWVES